MSFNREQFDIDWGLKVRYDLMVYKNSYRLIQITIFVLLQICDIVWFKNIDFLNLKVKVQVKEVNQYWRLEIGNESERSQNYF